MTATTAPEATADETVAEATPFIKLNPTRKRLNPTAYEGELVVLVTTNTEGRVRVALVAETDLNVGDVIEAKHAGRKFSYGDLTITGKVVNKVPQGEVPDKNLPLRLIEA